MAVDDPWAIDGLSLSALEWRRALSGLLQHDSDPVSARPGVLSGCDVTVSGLTATVGAGQVVVTPAAGSNGSYLVGMTATALSITARDATYARVDRVIARIYDNAIDGSGQSKAAVEIVTGTPAASPAAPALPAGALELAQLQVPNSAGGSIVVLDRRRRASAVGGCPWFVTPADRDLVVLAPSAGQLSVTGTGSGMVVWAYSGSAWVQIAPATVPGVTLSSPLPNPSTLTTTGKLVGTTGTGAGYPVDSATAFLDVNTAAGHDYCFQRLQEGTSPFRTWTRRGYYSGGSWAWSSWRCLSPAARARIVKNSTISLTVNTWTLVDGYASTSYNDLMTVDLSNGRLTTVEAGRYDIAAHHRWFNLASPSSRAGAIVLGTSAPATDGSNVLAMYARYHQDWLHEDLVVPDVQLATGDVITSWIRCGTTGAFNTANTTFAMPTSLSMRRTA